MFGQLLRIKNKIYVLEMWYALLAVILQFLYLSYLILESFFHKLQVTNILYEAPLSLPCQMFWWLVTMGDYSTLLLIGRDSISIMVYMGLFIRNC